MKTPTSLPPLATTPVMEYVALLAGEPDIDRPTCTHPALAELADVVDHVPASLVCRLIGTGERSLKIDQGMDVWLDVRVGREPSAMMLGAAVDWYHQLAGHAAAVGNEHLSAELG